jgi:hypothetical protein
MSEEKRTFEANSSAAPSLKRRPVPQSENKLLQNRGSQPAVERFPVSRELVLRLIAWLEQM